MHTIQRRIKKKMAALLFLVGNVIFFGRIFLDG